ncbi:MAG: 23S rRNA (adenine(2503)-C(2))-methyltransferase RlmN [bacterium]
MIDLKSLSEASVFDLFREMGLPSFRARQLLHWLYERNITDIEKITEFSRELRDKLKSIAYISTPALLSSELSSDGTTKFLFQLDDGERIESVLIPDRDRLTLCVSSQVGCAMGCGFCLTGGIGFKRNLRSREITDQVLSVNRMIEPRTITNIVFMGMGEPLLNLEEVGAAIRIMTKYIRISRRHITVSTCGIAPKIRELGQMKPLVNLAVSLNAGDDATRSGIMPVNRKYPLKKLTAALKEFPRSPRQRITFEYVLLRGINDSDEQARKTVQLLSGIPSKVNLIPYNPAEGSGFRKPGMDRVLAFQEILSKAGITAIIRKSKGSDIAAACGQLSARYSRQST